MLVLLNQCLRHVYILSVDKIDIIFLDIVKHFVQPHLLINVLYAYYFIETD